jgi:hypothetical protein
LIKILNDIKTSNSQLESLIKFLKDEKKIVGFRSVGLEKVCGLLDVAAPTNIISIYKKLDLTSDYLLTIMNKFSKLKTFSISQNSISIIAKNKLSVILFDVNLGLSDIKTYIIKFFDKIKSDNLKIICKTIDMIAMQYNLNLDKINKFKFVHDGLCSIFYCNVVPDRYWYQGKLNLIPPNKRILIDRIKIFRDIYGKISEVKLSTKHPNASNDGYLCLGSLEGKEFNETTIEEIIGKISMYNLEDCYWFPEWVKKET